MKNKFIKKIMAVSMVVVSTLTPMFTVLAADPPSTMSSEDEEYCARTACLVMASLNATAQYFGRSFKIFQNKGNIEKAMAKKLVKKWGFHEQYIKSLQGATLFCVPALSMEGQTLINFKCLDIQDNVMKDYGHSTWHIIDLMRDFIIDKDSKFSNALRDYDDVRNDVIKYLHACCISVDGEKVGTGFGDCFSAVVFFTLAFNLSQIEKFVSHNPDPHTQINAKNSICYIDIPTVIKHISSIDLKKHVKSNPFYLGK